MLAFFSLAPVNRSIVRCVALTLMAVVGFTAAASAQTRAAYGLDARPDNNTCLPFDRFASGAEVGLQRVYANLEMDFITSMVQPPADDSVWYIAGVMGQIWRFDNTPNVATKTVALDISAQVKIVQEGGLIKAEFHPNYPTDPRIFVNYSSPAADGVSEADIVISSFVTLDGGLTFDPSSEVVLIRQYRGGYHNGGFMEFAPDGMLIVAIGDGTGQGDFAGVSQDTSDLRGTFLRLDVSNPAAYSVPPDNPFVGSGGDPREEIFAWGTRNAYGGDIDSVTGDMWFGEVGFATYEEVNVLVEGANYGWNIKEGFSCHDETHGSCADPTLTDPVIEYAHEEGNCSVIGGVVYRGTAIPELDGRFIYGDYCTAKIAVAEPDPGPTGYIERVIVPPGFGLGQILSFAKDIDEEPYVVTGSAVFKIIPLPPGEVSSAPELLSQTGCFDPIDPTVPMPALIPFDMNSPLWSDNAAKRRWMALPNNTKVTVDADGDFLFPVGTILVKEFSLDGGPVETRLLVHHEQDVWAGYSYEWIGNDAVLLASGKRKVLPSGKPWSYPSRGECMSCHTSAANVSLGPEVVQLNGDMHYESTGRLSNQLYTMQHIGIFDGTLPAPIADQPALSGVSDTWHPTPHRARSYLQANCSGCHRPGGPTQVNADLRFQTATPDAQICDAIPGFGDLGIPGARLLFPGDPSSSLLHHRPSSADPVIRMPPLGTEIVHTDGMAVISSWIADSAVCDPTVDPDGDGVPSPMDNCPAIANASQWDLDEDGLGDRCDADHSSDADGDGVIEGEEIVFGTNPALADTDGDGYQDGEELAVHTDPLDAASNPSLLPDPDLILHYAFDVEPDTTGFVEDVSGKGHDATCTPFVDCPGFAAADGQPDVGALDLTAMNDLLVVPIESDFDFTTNFTAALWMKTSDFGAAWSQLIGKGDSSWSLEQYDGSGQLSFTTFAPTADSLQGVTNVEDGEWHHVAIVYDGAQKTLYVDGVVDAQAPLATALSTNNFNVQLGRNAEFASGQYDGLIDDVKVFSRALTPAEVAALVSGPPLVVPLTGTWGALGLVIAIMAAASLGWERRRSDAF